MESLTFAFDKYGDVSIVGFTSQPATEHYLEHGIGNSIPEAERAIQFIEKVIESGEPEKTGCEPILICVGPDTSCLIWLMGKLRDQEFELKTVDLLHYLIQLRDFLKQK